MLKWLNNKKKDNKGFSLVELIIVVAIMAILVGLLAPQYIKYVEKSRQSSDASNLDEMVRTVQLAAADVDGVFAEGEYKITLSYGTTEATVSTDKGDTEKKKVEDALTQAVPEWKKTTLKSSKWVNNQIYATIKVEKDGGTTVSYGNQDFAAYVNKTQAADAASTTSK